MDIYIKSFNRAYLLHRTIASIYHYLNDFNGRIVVLDDGTPQKYLDKIKWLFPEIEIIKSPYYEQKSKDILSQKVPKKIIPADFWRDEVLKGTEYFILLEDDMWFTQTINYINFSKDVYHSKMDMIKFRWLQNEKLISCNIINSSEYFKIVQPKILIKKAGLFDAVFRTNRLKLRSITRRILNINEELLKYYQLYIVAGGIFSKRYYETCWKSKQNKVDELQQISQLLRSKTTFNVGNTKEEILKATYKTTATLMAKENLGVTVDIFKINEILNNTWYLGNDYGVYNFEQNLPSVWMENHIESFSENGAILKKQWRQWYAAFKESYKNIGCNIE